MFTFCEKCGKKYSETEINNLFEVKRSSIQNIAVKKKEEDRKEFLKQPSIYRCNSCGFTLRVFNHERTKKELRDTNGHQGSDERRSFP